MPPIAQDRSPNAGSAPILDPPLDFSDPTALMTQLLAISTKLGNEQLSASMADAQLTTQETKARNKEIAKKMDEALQKMATAKAWGTAAKVGGWVALVLSVALAVVTGGATAIATAAIACAMQLAQVTGGLDKLTGVIASGLEKCGMSKGQAKGWAEVIMAMATIVLCLAPTGAIQAVGRATVNAAKAVAKMVVDMVKRILTAAKNALSGSTHALPLASLGNAVKTAAQVAREAAEAAAPSLSPERAKVAAGVKLAMAAVGGEQAMTQGEGSAKGYEASRLQGDVTETRAFIARLQQALDDETAQIQQIMKKLSDDATGVMQIMSRSAQTAMTIVHNGHATV